MARVVLIRHGDEKDDDRIVTYFRNKGLEPEIVRPFAGDELGDLGDDVIASAIYGGNFNVFEEEKHPFLYDENRWIEQCIEKQIPLLGLCQGAQSIARVLGAHVGPKEGEPFEFGYYEINPTEEGKAYFPEDLVVVQAHFHEFFIPEGAVKLASSQLFGQQAYKYGATTFGFQFHPEITPAAFRIWQDEKGFAYGRPGAQDRATQDELSAKHDLRMHRWFMDIQEKIFGEAVRKATQV